MCMCSRSLSGALMFAPTRDDHFRLCYVHSGLCVVGWRRDVIARVHCRTGEREFKRNAAARVGGGHKANVNRLL